MNGPSRDPAGSYSGDDDTRERKRRETVTEAAEKRYLKKRTREGGSKGIAVATALDAADDFPSTSTQYLSEPTGAPAASVDMVTLGAAPLATGASSATTALPLFPGDAFSPVRAGVLRTGGRLLGWCCCWRRST